MYNTVRTIKPTKKMAKDSQTNGPVTNSYMGYSLNPNPAKPELNIDD
jgi:hypothetical protein